MTILISLIFCILGGITYIVSVKAEFKELGRLSFFAGLLTFLLQLGPEAVKLLKG